MTAMKPPAGARLKRGKTILKIALLVLLCTAAAGWWQWQTGAWNVETLRHPDESAHFLNSLAVANYIRYDFGGNPLEFIQRLYLHYPALAPLVWPPLFHLLAGVWMLVCGPSPQAALAFVAVVMGVALALMWGIGFRSFGAPGATFVVGTLWALPLMADLATTIMADILLVAGSLAFAWTCARWLEQPEVEWRAAGLAAGLWGATKANGLSALIALPVAAALWRLPRRSWVSAARALILAALLSLPFAAISFALLRGHTPPKAAGWGAMAGRLAWYEMNARWQVGAPALLLAAAGLAWCGRALWRRKADAMDAAMLGTLAGTLAFHVLLPAPHNERYLAPMLPPILYFAAAAGRWLPWKHGVALAAAALALLVIPAKLEVIRQEPAGFRAAAARLLRQQPAPLRVLVAADELGETAFVAEMATAMPRRIDLVLRGSKVLSDSDWYGGDYRLLAANHQQMAALLEDLGVQIVVADHSQADSARADQRLMLAMLAAMPQRFPEVGRIDQGRQLTIHRVARPASPPRRMVSYSLSRSLAITVSEGVSEGR
jgi:hypothetical protein